MHTDTTQNTKIKKGIFCSLITVFRSLKSGFTLFYAVLMASLLLAIALAVLNISFKEFTLSSGARDSNVAFYAADSALECALYWDNTTRSFGYYGDSLAEGIAGFWRFEDHANFPEEDIEVTADSSGRGHHGTLIDMGSGAWVSGYNGEALEFDNVEGYVRTSRGPVLGGDARTVTMWVKLDLANVTPTDSEGGPSTDTLITWGGTGSGERFTIALYESNTVYVEIDDSTAFNTKASIPTDNDYHFIAVVQDGDDLGNVTAYVDTTESPSGTGGSIDTDDTYGVHIGSSFGGTDNLFFGVIDEVRVYDRALTSVEIEAIRQGDILAGFVPPVAQDTTPLLCAGADINDPETGWWETDAGSLDNKLGWEVEDLSVGLLDAYQTTFDMLFEDNTCALVEVYKDSAGSSTITARGYNTCNLDSPRRVERAIKAQY